jgi:hypothetical protein
MFKSSKLVTDSAPILTPDAMKNISTDFDDFDDIDFTSPHYKRNIKRSSKLCPIPVSFLIDESDDDMTIGEILAKRNSQISQFSSVNSTILSSSSSSSKYTVNSSNAS